MFWSPRRIDEVLDEIKREAEECVVEGSLEDVKKCIYEKWWDELARSDSLYWEGLKHAIRLYRERYRNIIEEGKREARRKLNEILDSLLEKEELSPENISIRCIMAGEENIITYDCYKESVDGVSYDYCDTYFGGIIITDPLYEDELGNKYYCIIEEL